MHSGDCIRVRIKRNELTLREDLSVIFKFFLRVWVLSRVYPLANLDNPFVIGRLRVRKLPPIELLKYLMEEHGMNTVSLGKLVGGSGQASLVLRGKRELSKANIRALADRFNVSPALFL